MFILKTIPIIYAIIFFILIIIQFFGIDVGWLGLIGGVSLIPLIFLYISSYVFKFCYYHRISLHYLSISQSLCIFDYYIRLPIDLLTLFIIHIGLFVLLIVQLIYFKLK